MTAYIKGLSDRITVENVDTMNVDPRLAAENPLGKIPVLVLDDGTQLYDSKVICEYLDSLAPSPRLFPAASPDRWRTLTLGALADGIMEAALLMVYEKRYRAENLRLQSWLDRQQSKVDAGLKKLEADPPKWAAHPDYGHLALAAALGYLDLRHEGRWRATHPRLVAWLDAFASAVPAYAKTAPPPA